MYNYEMKKLLHGLSFFAFAVFANKKKLHVLTHLPVSFKVRVTVYKVINRFLVQTTSIVFVVYN